MATLPSRAQPSDERGRDRSGDRDHVSTPTGTATWPSEKRPDARPIRPPARLRTVIILPPEPSRKSANLVNAGVKVVSGDGIGRTRRERGKRDRDIPARSANLKRVDFLTAPLPF